MSANPPRAPGELAEVIGRIKLGDSSLRYILEAWAEPFEHPTRAEAIEAEQAAEKWLQQIAAEIAALRASGDGGEAKGWRDQAAQQHKLWAIQSRDQIAYGADILANRFSGTDEVRAFYEATQQGLEIQASFHDEMARRFSPTKIEGADDA